MFINEATSRTSAAYYRVLMTFWLPGCDLSLFSTNYIAIELSTVYTIYMIRIFDEYNYNKVAGIIS